MSTNVTAVESSARNVGLVLCNGTPVSPFTPLTVIRLAFPAGGIISTPVTEKPVTTGIVIVLFPELRLIKSSFPSAVTLSLAASDI